MEGHAIRILQQPGWLFGDVALLFNSPRWVGLGWGRVRGREQPPVSTLPVLMPADALRLPQEWLLTPFLLPAPPFPSHAQSTPSLALLA